MRDTRLRIAATTFVVLLSFIIPTILLIRSQAAQTTNQTNGQAQRVLIEKNQVVEGSVFPEMISTSQPVTHPDETANTLQPRFDSALRSFERGAIRDTAFSAEVQVETVWPLREGGTTQRKSTYLIYRDSQGRTRLDLMSDQTNATDSRPRTSVINDPAASSTYLLDHRRATVRKMPLVAEVEQESQPRVVQTTRGTAPGFINVVPQNSHVAKAIVIRERSASQLAEKEQLGQREISGVIAEGTRFVRAISLGASGNENPIQITTEEWYSIELQTIVAITISDPRFGRSEYRLVNIVRGDPSPALFVIPQTYKVKVE
jgi:hypothetical protein